MAINFPSSPSLGQLYTFAGNTWEWSGDYWQVYSGVSSSVVYSITTSTGLSADTITGNVTLLNTLPNYAGGVLTNYSGWTNNGNGTMNLPSVQVALYDNTNFLEPLRVYTVASGVTGSGGISGLTDNDTNYIYIEYNNGSPRWVVSTDNSAINGSTVVRFQNVYRIGNFIHNLEWGNEGAGLPNKIANRIDSVNRFARESGLSLGLSGSTGVVTLSSGVAWNGTLRQSLDPVNSQTDIFFQNFHSGGTWVISTTADTLNNTYYDDGTDRVVASAGTYLVNWYFRGQEINDHLYEVWGNTAYTSVAAAQLSLEPALPELITSHAFLLGRIIVQQGALTGFVETAFVTPFQPTTVQNHNDLTGLQGGSAGQYYHLNANQYNNIALTNVNNNFSSSQTINGDLNVTGQTSSSVISVTTITGGTFFGNGSGLTNVQNIYNNDGTLSANRTLSLSGNYLDIQTSGGTSRFFASGNISIGAITDTGNKLYVSSIADPVRFENMTTVSSDSFLITANSNGVLREIGGNVANRIPFFNSSSAITTSTELSFNGVDISLPVGQAGVTFGNGRGRIYTPGVPSGLIFETAASQTGVPDTSKSFTFRNKTNNNQLILDHESTTLPRARVYGQLEVTNTGSQMQKNFWGRSGILTRVLSASVADINSTGGTYTDLVANSFATPTFSATTGGNYTSLTTVYIDGAPSVSANMTGQTLALKVNSGNVLFGGLQLNSTDTRVLTSDNNGLLRYRNISDFNTGSTSVSGDYLPLSGGTVTGSTTFTNGLTANTISGGTFFGDGSNLTNIVTSVSVGSGLSGNSTTGNITLINTAPDQTVVLNNGTGINTSGTYPNFTITNTAPDQTVTVTGGTNIQILGSYPNFGVNYTGQTEFPYLPLSGGTVTGDTIFQSGLTANTISATTISGNTLYGDGSNLTNVQNLYNINGSLQSNRVVNLNSNSLSFSSSTTSGQTKIYNNGKVLIGKEFNTINFPIPSSNYLLSLGNDGTNDYGQGLVIKPWTGDSQFTFGSTGTGLISPSAGTANLNITSYVDYSSYYDFPTGFRLDVIGKNIPTETSPSSGLMNISFFSGNTSNSVTNRSLLTINNGGGVGIFNTPILKIFSSGNIGLNTGTESGQRLHISSASDPVRFEGLQILNTDTQVVTTDTNGVLHKRTYDYITGFTYANTANTLTIRTSSGNTFDATINQMTGLTINGNLTVTGNYFVSGDTVVSGNTVFTGSTTYNTVNNAIGDFLTLPTSNIMSKRTAHEVRDDIGYYGLTFAITNGYY